MHFRVVQVLPLGAPRLCRMPVFDCRSFPPPCSFRSHQGPERSKSQFLADFHMYQAVRVSLPPKTCSFSGLLSRLLVPRSARDLGCTRDFSPFYRPTQVTDSHGFFVSDIPNLCPRLLVCFITLSWASLLLTWKVVAASSKVPLAPHPPTPVDCTHRSQSDWSTMQTRLCPSQLQQVLALLGSPNSYRTFESPEELPQSYLWTHHLLS